MLIAAAVNDKLRCLVGSLSIIISIRIITRAGEEVRAACMHARARASPVGLGVSQARSRSMESPG